MVFVAFLLPPGLMCLTLALGRYEEWAFKQPPEPARPAGHARKGHLSLVPHTGYQARVAEDESERRRGADAA